MGCCFQDLFKTVCNSCSHLIFSLCVFVSVHLVTDTMLGIRCIGVCGCQSDDPFVCFGSKPTQTACARDRKWMKEGRSERGQNESQQKVPGEDSEQMRVRLRGGQSTEVRKAAARISWPTDAGWPTREVKSALLVALWEFSLEYTLALAHRNTECTKSVT